MKKNLTKRIALALALILIAISAFALSSCTSYDLPEGAVDWTLSEDFKTLTNETDGTVYKSCEPWPFVYALVGDVYVYCDRVTWNLSESYSPEFGVYRLINSKDFVWLESGETRYYFATDEGKEQIDALKNGKIGSYRLRKENIDYYQPFEVHKGLIAQADANLKNGIDVENINVGLLDNYNAYYIEAFDPERNISYNYAAVFTVDNYDFLYVKLSEIDHQLINEYGRIHYDKLDEINVTHLNSSSTYQMRSYINEPLEYSDITYEYEGDMLQSDNEDISYAVIVVGSMTFFWTAVVVIGFIAPIPLIALGCALAFIKKLGRPKYWLWVAAFALLWMLFAALFSLIIILIILI